MTLAHAYAIAEARSCLAALADNARSVEASIEYDRLLIHLDGIVDDYVAGIWALDEADPERLLARLDVAVEELVACGLDCLSAELLLDMAIGAGESSEPR